MNRLKFSKDNGLEFYRELMLTINDHFKNRQTEGNSKMIFKIIFYFALDIIFYVLMITSHSPFAFYTFYLLMGVSVLLTAFNVSHDAAHGVAVKSKRLNKFLFTLSFNLQGNNAYIWEKNHNGSHHLYTNVEGSDIDVLNNPLFRMMPSQKLKWFHRFQPFYAPILYLLYSLNWCLFRETLMVFNVSSRTIKITMPVNEIIKLVVCKILYLGFMIALPIYMLSFGWLAVISAFVINHFIASVIFVGVLGVSHVSDFVKHPAPDNDNTLSMSWPMLQMCTSVDYNPASRFFNWTLGGFNAHALHHLLPNICHIHYLEILPIFRTIARKHGVVYMEMSYWNSLKSHFRYLRDMGRFEQPELRDYERPAY